MSARALCAVSAWHEWLRMRRGGVAVVARRVGEIRRYTGDVQRRLTLVRLKPWAVAPTRWAGDQVGDVALIDAVVQALRRCTLGLGHTGLVRVTVWQSRRSAACIECE